MTSGFGLAVSSKQIGLSMESASYLVHDRPPGGWESLVTKDELRAAMAELKAELRQEMRDQTRWLAGVLIVSITLVATIVGTISGAIVRLA